MPFAHDVNVVSKGHFLFWDAGKPSTIGKLSNIRNFGEF